jgi:D-alanine-D-alanine ligase
VPGREFYDYRAKYLEDTTELRVPATVPAEIEKRIRRAARQAFQVLGCAGLARVDFFLERPGEVLWLNEINTLPGFTSISMYPRLWAQEGMSLVELVARLAELGLERHQARSRNLKTLPDRDG